MEISAAAEAMKVCWSWEPGSPAQVLSDIATNWLPTLGLNFHNCEMGVTWVTSKFLLTLDPLSLQKLLQAEPSWA